MLRSKFLGRNAKILLSLLLKRNCCHSKSLRDLHAVRLIDRGLVHIEGKESSEFLQGLITNDMNHLTLDGTSIYTMFLNVQGRVLLDSHIVRQNSENYLIDCDRQVISSLIKHLKVYRLRRKVDIEESNSYSIWVVFNKDLFLETGEDLSQFSKASSSAKDTLVKTLPTSAIVTTDPRLKYLGERVILPEEESLNGTFTVCSGNIYKLHRYKLGVGEGCSEFISGKTLPLEANCDYMHGVSFHKGCYVGQELTARSFHTGVIRKRIMPLSFDINTGLPPGTVIENENNKSVGKVVSVFQNYGLGLMNISKTMEAGCLSIHDGDTAVKTLSKKPFWWPKEAPKERQT